MGRGRIREGQKTFIPIRLITAGVMPIIFAQTIIIVPSTVANFTRNQTLTDIANFFTPGDWGYNIIKNIGNYAEVFDRNLGENTALGLSRGPNTLWNDGGLLYPPPFR